MLTSAGIMRNVAESLSMTAVRYIEENGRRRFAIVPMRLWRKAIEALESREDSRALKRAGRDDEGCRTLASVAARMAESGSAVCAWREHRGLSQAQLAARAGISKAYLSQIETGARQGSVRALKALAGALNVPLDALAE